jgi:hypothetical protein
MPESVEDNLKRWLLTSGFPLEMRVAATWEAAGFGVSQGVYFVDPETSTARETDVIASKEHFTADASLAFVFVVECKGGPEGAWVLFPRSGGPLPPKTRVVRLGTVRSNRPYLSRVARRIDVLALAAFNTDRRPAYGLVHALREKKPDLAYEALMSVAKASVAMLKEITTEADDDMFHIVWPVIVTETPLFEARLSASHDIDLERVTRGQVAWRHPIATPDLFIVDVVHMSALTTYVAEVNTAVELLLHNTEQELADTVAKRRANKAASPPTA